MRHLIKLTLLVALLAFGTSQVNANTVGRFLKGQDKPQGGKVPPPHDKNSTEGPRGPPKNGTDNSTALPPRDGNHSEGNHTDATFHNGTERTNETLPHPPRNGSENETHPPKNATNGTKDGKAKPPKGPKKNKTSSGKRLLEGLLQKGRDDKKGPKGPKGPKDENHTEGNETQEGNHTEGEKGGKKNKGEKLPNVNFTLADATNLIKTTTTPLLTSTLLPNETKRYVIGYGHVGKDVKKNQTINETQADTFLTGDLYRAAGCLEQAFLKKSKAPFTTNQLTALVSFAQSIPCDLVEKYYKKNKLSATSTPAELEAFFTGAITAADAKVAASSELSARRNAEKSLFSKAA